MLKKYANKKKNFSFVKLDPIRDLCIIRLLGLFFLMNFFAQFIFFSVFVFLN
jgi:hypothetical protein